MSSENLKVHTRLSYINSVLSTTDFAHMRILHLHSELYMFIHILIKLHFSSNNIDKDNNLIKHIILLWLGNS